MVDRANVFAQTENFIIAHFFCLQITLIIPHKVTNTIENSSTITNKLSHQISQH